MATLPAELAELKAELIVLTAEVKASKVAIESSHIITTASLSKLESAVSLTNTRLRAMEEWRAKVEGMLLGSRATLTVLALLVGLAAGVGLEIVVK